MHLKIIFNVGLMTFAVLASGSNRGLQAQEENKLDAEQIKFFEARIRPVLIRECYSCHSNQVGQVKGGLWLDTQEGLLTGGDSGPAVVPNNLEESLLWSAINHIDYAMPPRRKLSDEILEDFRTWIEMGAPDPRQNAESDVRSTITAADISKGREFWSFHRPEQPAVPEVADLQWGKTEIDRFVFAKLVEKICNRLLKPIPTRCCVACVLT